MKLFLSALLATFVMAGPVAAHAETVATDPAEMHGEHAVTFQAYTLADGTTVVIEEDVLYVQNADGTKTVAPDGAHTTADGKVLTVKDGKLAK